MSELVLDKVRDYLQTLLPSLGLELFELQFRREGHGWVLRIFIDAPETIGLDHCTAVSRELSQYLDVEDLIGHAYHLEVSSPGLERPLRALGEFERFCGKKVKIRLHDAIDERKIFEGVLTAVVGDRISLDLTEGGSAEFSHTMISKARLAL